MVRAAAEWRAVRLALVAGAVFFFGVLCGEEARAADGPPPAGGAVREDAVGVRSVLEGLGAVVGDAPAARKPTGSESRVADDEPALRERGSRVDAGAAARPAVRDEGARSGARSDRQPVVRPDVQGASESLVASVTRSAGQCLGVEPDRAPGPDGGTPAELGVGRVLRPVGQVVGGVSEELDAVVADLPVLGQVAELPPRVLPSPPSLPQLPALPQAPALPALPDIPDLPVVPDAPGLSGHPGAPGLPGLPGVSEPPAHLLPAPAAEAPLPPSAAAHGPVVPATLLEVAGTPAQLATPPAPAAPRAVPAPPRAPHTGGVESGGALGGRSSADQGGVRHLDAGAVTASRRPLPRLVPGATVPARTPGTREHSRDVHVPPA